MSSTNNNSTNNNNLSEFLSFESKQHQNSSSSSSSSSDDSTNIGHHALNQLLESKLGDELTWSAQKLGMLHTDNSDQNTILFEEEVAYLLDTRTCQQMNAQISRECPTLSSLLLPSSNQSATVNDKREDGNITTVGSSNKKSREGSTDATNKPPAAATSFSLFDLMDSQKSAAFMLPPRIMAQQVIDADKRSTSDDNDDSTMQEATNNNNNKSALELLEQAQDMEDLSPDLQSWELIQSILYRGLLTNSNMDLFQEERHRFFKVHESIFEKCQQRTNGAGGGVFRCQTWGVTFNIIGFILSLSNNEEFENQNVNDEQVVADLDLYWDSCHHLLSSLSHLAREYVTCSIGHEKEMERMMFGLCSILCSDVSSCVLAMMGPMAGWFEVWARFVVGPTRLMTILRVSGLGEMVLRRCESRGRNEGSVRLHELLCQRDDGSGDCPSLKDLEESNFLQSLSILRVIVSRCGATLGSMGTIFCCSNVVSPSFLSADGGIVTIDEVQAMLETKEQSSSMEEQIEIRRRVLQAFRGVLLLKESSPGLVDADLEELCTQTLALVT